jgi:hypothetical protein
MLNAVDGCNLNLRTVPPKDIYRAMPLLQGFLDLEYTHCRKCKVYGPS